MNRPIFVIGSPRSGTSILTWCLGQHSNILAQEETDWLGRFTLDVESAYQIGTRRAERSQLGALGVKRDDFFAAFGNSINELILGHRREQTRIAREQAVSVDRSKILPAFKTERAEGDPKKRWADGTPENSFYVYGLRKLFPEAVFIHIFRDVASVVRSLLRFTASGAAPLVENEQQAYDRWLRTVRACIEAEHAYGSSVVHRMRHADLAQQSEQTMRQVLDFLGERFEPACLEPLQSRINSSNVPADFQCADPTTDPKLVREAHQVESELFSAPIKVGPCEAAAAELEANFRKRVQFNQNVPGWYKKSLSRIAELESENRRPLQTGEGRRRLPWLGRRRERNQPV
jgi:hypothetical protein